MIGIAFIPSENQSAEIESEQLEGAYLVYEQGGFRIREFFVKDDYEVLQYFEYEGEDE